MKSVLITNMYAGIGGGEIAILDHIDILQSQGVNVTVMLLEHGDFEQRLREKGVEDISVFPFGWRGGKFKSLMGMLDVIWRIFSLLRKSERKYEIVISYTLNDLIFAGVAAKFLKLPIVYRGQADVIGVDKDINATWMGRYFFSIFKWISPYVIATTKGEIDRLLDLGYPENKLQTIYLGVDEKKYDISEKKVAALRDQLCVANKEYVISIFGRLTEWKGQMEFISALGQISEMGYPVRGWIVGDSDFGGGESYKEGLVDHIRAEKLDKKISMLGMRNDVAELMAASDIVVHASYKEPFGMVVIEAMMCGKPVIASNVSGPRESIVANESGILIEPKDVEALAGQLKNLLDNTELRQTLGLAAKKRAERLFDKRKNLYQLNSFCDDILRHRR